MRKRLIVASLLFGLLAAGIAGGAVLAQSTDDDTTARGRGEQVIAYGRHPGQSCRDSGHRTGSGGERVRAGDSRDLQSRGLRTCCRSSWRWASSPRKRRTPTRSGWMPGRRAISRASRAMERGATASSAKVTMDSQVSLMRTGCRISWRRACLPREQSDAYQEWLDARPEVAFPDSKGKGERSHGFFGKGHDGFGEKH